MGDSGYEAAPLPQPVTSPYNRWRLLDYLGIFFGFTTVAGFVLAFYWHAESVQERTPTYYVSPERTRIVDTSVPAPSKLQVLYKGRDLGNNVTAALVYFWNAGKLPIKADEVLEPISIELEPSVEILDARLLKVSRPVTRFLKGDVVESAKNLLPLSFNILEHDDGAAVQIIYLGKQDSDISVKGSVIGAGQPRELVPQIRERHRRKPSGERRVSIVLLGISFIFTMLTSLLFLVVIRNRAAEVAGGRILSLSDIIRGRKMIAVQLVLALSILSGALIAFSVFAVTRAEDKASPGVPAPIWLAQ